VIVTLSASALRVRTFGAGAFVATTFAVGGVLFLPAVLARAGVVPGPPERYELLVLLGFFAPTLAALLLSALERGRGGLRETFRPLGAWRVGVGWYLVALLLPGATFVCALAVHVLATGHPPGPWLYPPSDAQHVAAMCLIPLTDQIGWRGFAFPRLERRIGPLAASLLLGVAWAGWHVGKAALLEQGTPPALQPFLFLYCVAGYVVFSWLYLRTGESLVIVVIAHMGAYLENPSQALPANATPFILQAVGLGVVAVTLVLADRGAWRPRRHDEGIALATQ
jgi:uncharacterized protein